MNTMEILQAYPTLQALQGAEVWKTLKVKDRLDVLKAYQTKTSLVAPPDPIPVQPTNEQDKHVESFSLNIKLNEMQQAAVDMAKQGKSFCLTGKAGTGKTTTEREIVRALVEMGIAPSDIGLGAYTRVATGNARKSIERDPILAAQPLNICTIHKHLEYGPVFFTDASGKDTMRFVPARTATNKLTYKVFLMDEASMTDLLLFNNFFDAMPEGMQMIYVGDINQLQPAIGGQSIFTHALLQLPVIELSEVYRQALDSGILRAALDVLDGTAPETNPDVDIIYGNPNKIISARQTAQALGQTDQNPAKDGFFHKLYKAGKYDPTKDMILSPWNKRELGSLALNNWIAQWLGDERGAVVHEIIASRRKLYLAEGDRVLIDKQEGIISKILFNGAYVGKPPLPSGKDLLRTGHYRIGGSVDFEEEMADTVINVDDESEDMKEKKLQASHIVEVTMLDSDTQDKVRLETAGDFSEQSFSLGYATTVYKAQGCEWPRVFFILHQDHMQVGALVNREMVYTAMTRPREHLTIITKPQVFAAAVKRQGLPGQTVQEKLKHFRAKLQTKLEPVHKPGQWTGGGAARKPAVQQPKPVFNPVPARKPVPFVDFSRYVPEEFRMQAEKILDAAWTKAQDIFGDIGTIPSLTFDCQRGSILGLANYRLNSIKLNPIFCIADSTKSHMLHTTIVHEVCHHIAKRFSGDTKHEKGWATTMKLMGLKPEQYYTGPMPDWKAECAKLLQMPIDSITIIEGELSEEESE